MGPEYQKVEAFQHTSELSDCQIDDHACDLRCVVFAYDGSYEIEKDFAKVLFVLRIRVIHFF